MLAKEGVEDGYIFAPDLSAGECNAVVRCYGVAIGTTDLFRGVRHVGIDQVAYLGWQSQEAALLAHRAVLMLDR